MSNIIVSVDFSKHSNKTRSLNNSTFKVINPNFELSNKQQILCDYKRKMEFNKIEPYYNQFNTLYSELKSNIYGYVYSIKNAVKGTYDIDIQINEYNNLIAELQKVSISFKNLYNSLPGNVKGKLPIIKHVSSAIQNIVNNSFYTSPTKSNFIQVINQLDSVIFQLVIAH